MAVAGVLQLPVHLVLLSYNRAEPGPRVGVYATIKGPRGSRMGLGQGKHDREGTDRWMRGREHQKTSWKV